jgi:hypothetical protein
MAVTMAFTVVLDVTPYSLVDITNRYFHRLGRRKYFYTEDGRSTKTLVRTSIYQNLGHQRISTLVSLYFFCVLLINEFCNISKYLKYSLRNP